MDFSPIKLVANPIVSVIVLAIIARIPNKFVDDDPFFAAQTWTLRDAYKILIPTMVFCWIMMVVAFFLIMLSDEEWYGWVGLGWIAVLLVYGVLHRLILKPYRVNVATFGLDKAGYINSVTPTVTVILFILLIISQLSQFPGRPDASEISHARLGTICLMILGIGVAQSLVDEFLFRGVLYAPLFRKFGKWGAIICITLLTWLMHVGFAVNLTETAAIFGTSILFTYIYYRNKSLYGPIILHIFWNWGSLVGLMSGLLPSEYFHEFSIVQKGSYWVGLGIFLYWISYKKACLAEIAREEKKNGISHEG